VSFLQKKTSQRKFGSLKLSDPLCLLSLMMASSNSSFLLKVNSMASSIFVKWMSKDQWKPLKSQMESKLHSWAYQPRPAVILLQSVMTMVWLNWFWTLTSIREWTSSTMMDITDKSVELCSIKINLSSFQLVMTDLQMFSNSIKLLLLKKLSLIHLRESKDINSCQKRKKKSWFHKKLKSISKIKLQCSLRLTKLRWEWMKHLLPSPSRPKSHLVKMLLILLCIQFSSQNWELKKIIDSLLLIERSKK